MKRWHLLLVSLLLAPACGAQSDEDDAGNKPPPEPTLIGVEGVAIQQVAIYQGVKRVLAEGGVQAAPTAPLVAGRDALLRVFYNADPQIVGRQVKGRLTLDGQAPIDVDGWIAAASLDEDIGTTINFPVPGALIGESFAYRVEILEEEADGKTDNPAAHHPAGGSELHAVETKQNTFRVVLAPFQYNADGSGRLPNLSPEAVEIHRLRLMQLYPVSNVELSVHDPIPWSQPIGPDGTGWQQVGLRTFQLRGEDGAPDDVYYYSMFNPTASFTQFCLGGCLLGVTLLNNMPPDTGDVALRLALGVGFDEVASNTMAHELGHAHGRPHAPCGPGLDPQSIDPSYPYQGGQIGSWGWDIVSGALVPPTASDIMGYCDNQWISDYNFNALALRVGYVNLPLYGQPTGLDRYDIVSVDGQGLGRFLGSVERSALSRAELPVSVVDQNGQHRDVRGHYFAFDHLPGGWMMFPQASAPAVRAEAVVDGRRVVASR